MQNICRIALCTITLLIFHMISFSCYLVAVENPSHSTAVRHKKKKQEKICYKKFQFFCKNIFNKKYNISHLLRRNIG